MRKWRKPVISGLERFGLTRAALRRLGSRSVSAEVHIRIPPFVYPSMAEFRRLARKTPHERRSLVRRWRTREHQRLRREIPFATSEVMRFNGDPIGLRLTIAAQSVHKLLRLRHAGSIRIQRIAGMRPALGTRVSAQLYAVKARFGFQVESQRKGMQLYEDRIVVLSARSEKEARERAVRRFATEHSPYLSTSGHFLRWSFEGILDVCEAPDREFQAQGTEVYYSYRKRRFTRKHAWRLDG